MGNVKNARKPKGDTISRDAMVQALYAVLKKHTDGEGCAISNIEIAKKLMTEHGLYREDALGNRKRLETKKITKTLLYMVDRYNNVDYLTVTPTGKTTEEGDAVEHYDDWFYVKGFSDADLLHIVNLLRFSKYIDYQGSRKLIDKIAELSGNAMQFKDNHSFKVPMTMNSRHVDIALNESIERINKAIVEKKQIRFQFFTYGLDDATSRIVRLNKPEKTTLTPYALVMANSRYFMIASFDATDERANDKAYHYQLDYLSDIEVLDDKPARPIGEITALKKDINFTNYMNEHIYMRGGRSVRAVFRFDRDYVSTILDWFGERVIFESITKDSVTASVVVNEESMVYWALQYWEFVEILEPSDLRDKICEAVEHLSGKYLGSGEPKD